MKKALIVVGVVILLAVAGRTFWAYQQVKVDEQSLNIVQTNLEPVNTTTPVISRDESLPPVGQAQIVGNNRPKSTSAQIETTDWKLYKNELYGLSFKYPGDWGNDIYSPQGNRLDLVRSNSLSLRIPADYSALTTFVEKYHFEGIQIEVKLDEGLALDDYVKSSSIKDPKTLTVGGAQAIQGKQTTKFDSESIDSYFTFVKHGPFIYKFRNKPSEAFLVGGATSESAQDIHNKILGTVEFI